MANSPLVVIEKVEYTNHVDTAEILRQLHKIHRAVVSDTAVEEALIKENTDLRKELEDVLSGATLPPEVQQKINLIFEKVTASTAVMQKAITDNQTGL